MKKIANIPLHSAEQKPPFNVEETELYKTLEKSMYVMLSRKLDNAIAGDDIVEYCKVLAMDLIKAGLSSLRCNDLRDALDKWGREQTKWPTAKNIIDMMKVDKGAVYLPSPGTGTFSYDTKAAKKFKEKMREMRELADK